MTMYIYQVVREKPDGTRGKRSKPYRSWEPDLHVGGLYTNLGTGFPGLQRVISMGTKEFPD